MTQAEFRAALLDPAAAVPSGLTDAAGRAAGRRFAVYRNNVVVSLSDALQVAFPVVARLVGESFFRALAAAFLRAHPPSSPLLMTYGAEFPGFIEHFPPAAGLPYLPDVARLEQALRESYHAADPAVAGPTCLAVEPERLFASRLRFAPSLRLVRSSWPIHAIWRFNTSGGEKPGPGAEDVLVTRPGFDPVATVLPTGCGAALGTLTKGGTLGEAGETAPDADLAALFRILLAGNAVVAIEELGR